MAKSRSSRPPGDGVAVAVEAVLESLAEVAAGASAGAGDSGVVSGVASGMARTLAAPRHARMTGTRHGHRGPYAGPVTTQEPGPEHHGTPLGRSAPVEPLAVPTRQIIGVGIGLWAVALVVTLVVPALHTGERSWWPWTCVAGLALGSLGYAYMRRGRGNAAGAL